MGFFVYFKCLGFDNYEKLFAPTVPLGRPAKPEEMAYAAVFFGSDECTYCTGALLVVDGGVTSA
ncbi:SDR family oxidoreductase [Dehalobacter sp. DCM]|uniref:SDR family oxidoreductase n=1 Tax=Dehalobacter sp. DCM TaxID=2907827 RepID=UPI0030820923|nr:SDR family oxidoreductase [Dehalobacter sp. DCM]